MSILNKPTKYYCYLKTKRTNKHDEAVLLNFKNVTFIENYEELIKSLQPGDSAIFYDVLELDHNGDKQTDEILKTYKEIMHTGAELMFEKSASCDSTVIQYAVEEFDRKKVLKGTKETAFDAILELQIQSYILTDETYSGMRRTANVVANKLEGKRIGRPAGSSKETPKAKRIKARILNESVDFYGKIPVGQLIDSLDISRQTYYNYKKQLLEKEGKEK